MRVNLTHIFGMLLLAVGVFAGGIFGASLLFPQQILETPPSPVVEVQRVELPSAPTTAPTPVPEAPEPTSPEVSPPAVVEGLSVPSLKLTIPLEGLKVEDGQLTPPTFDTGYVVDGYSVPLTKAKDGSVYVVFHSRRDGTGLGNNFFNQESGKPKVKDGAIITVDGLEYKVSETLTVPKDELPHRNDIWEKTPGTLYLITCLQNAQRTDSTHNFIVVAELQD